MSLIASRVICPLGRGHLEQGLYYEACTALDWCSSQFSSLSSPRHQSGGELRLLPSPDHPSGHLAQANSHMGPIVPEGVLLVSSLLPTLEVHQDLPGAGLLVVSACFFQDMFSGYNSSDVQRVRTLNVDILSLLFNCLHTCDTVATSVMPLEATTVHFLMHFKCVLMRVA